MTHHLSIIEAPQDHVDERGAGHCYGKKAICEASLFHSLINWIARGHLREIKGQANT